MYEQVTTGISVSVDTEFKGAIHARNESVYTFSYHIVIQNQSDKRVRLLRREWLIFDSLNDIRRVSGGGVVGKYPSLIPGEEYSYDSGCQLNGIAGSMRGNYTFIDLDTEVKFQVEIPQFQLLAYPS